MLKIKITDIPIIYINLKQDTRKKNQIESMLSEKNFKNIYRSEGVEIKDKPRQVGIALAFKKAFEKAFSITKEEDYFIVFEDDVVPRNCFTEEIELPNDFEAVYLGTSKWGIIRDKEGNYVKSGPHIQGSIINKDLMRIYNMLSGHAILYKKSEYVKKIYTLMNEAVKTQTYQDIEFAKTMKNYKVYAFMNPLFYQTSSENVTNCICTPNEIV